MSDDEDNNYKFPAAIIVGAIVLIVAVMISKHYHIDMAEVIDTISESLTGDD